MTVTIPSTAKNSLKINGIAPSALGLSLLQSTNRLVVGGGTVTSSNPILDLSQIWNNAGVAFTGANLAFTSTASAAASSPLTITVDGGVNFKLFKNPGSMQCGLTGSNGWGTSQASAVITLGRPDGSGGINSGTEVAEWPINNKVFGARGSFFIGTTYAARDVLLERDAANTLALRNALSENLLRIYGTYTSSSDYKRGVIGIISNNFIIGTEHAGASGGAVQMQFRVANTDCWTLKTNGTFAPGANNTYDIGGGADYNPRHVYASTSMQVISNTGYIGIGASSPDVFLYREAANTLAQRNGINNQTLNIYNTYTSSTNYERLSFLWASNIAWIYTNKGATGSSRDLVIGTEGNSSAFIFTNGSNRWQFNGSGHLLAYTNNTYNIGAPSANQPRHIYAGTDVVSPKFVATSPQTYAASNVTTDRTYDANATTVDELADIVGTLISDLRTLGLVA